jgi:hypothetical protein
MITLTDPPRHPNHRPTWLSRSRSAVVVAALLLSGCTSTSTAAPPTDPTNGTVSAASSASAAPAESTGSDAHEGELEYTPGPSAAVAAPARTVGDRFAKLWARRTVPAEVWLQDLAPLCTTYLHTKLKNTDPGNVPAAAVTGQLQAASSRVNEVVFHVPTDGGTLILAVTRDAEHGGGWLVAHVDFRRAA